MPKTSYATGADIKQYLLQNQEALDITETSAIYLFLHNEVCNGKIQDNALFTFMFRAFYHMDNRNVTETFNQTFFSIMEQQRSKKRLPNLTTITYDLYQVKNKNNNPSMQFPLVTNMINTIYPNFPTYTPEMAKLFSFTSIKHLSGFYKKMQRFIEQYRHLHQTYLYLVQDPDIQPLLQRIDAPLPQMKKVDILVIEASKLAGKSE